MEDELQLMLGNDCILPIMEIRTRALRGCRIA
nr:MAG TPA: hypothetical protein [Caudoviricetes sp.]